MKSKSADFKGVDRQIDTYYKVARGRLKLREGNIENYLVYYDRENKEGPKESSVILFKHEPGSELKDILTHAADVLAVVDKTREIYFIDNVKFHIDVVENLGSFVEIEAIDRDGSIGREKLYAQCRDYMKLLGIAEACLVSGSYSDLLLDAVQMQS